MCRVSEDTYVGCQRKYTCVGCQKTHMWAVSVNIDERKRPLDDAVDAPVDTCEVCLGSLI